MRCRNVQMSWRCDVLTLRCFDAIHRSMIITVAGWKGGVGKTTTAINIAAEWKLRERRVLVVDADPQGSALTWAEVASELGHEPPTVVGMGDNLTRQLPDLAEAYDVVIIDCPPRQGKRQGAALLVADIALLPCGPGPVDAWALAETVEAVTDAQTLRPDMKAAIVITRKVARTAIGRSARSVLEDVGVHVLSQELGFRVAFQEAVAAGLGVTQYGSNSVAADEVRGLVDELEELMEGADHAWGADVA